MSAILDFINIYREFSKLYLKTKRFEEASAYQHRYITLKDSIIGEKLIQNIAAVQAKIRRAGLP